ncbi:hypothetical protein K493DRAFT_320354 [Basidiobolus meristosporus CBS 931.73]|uniref:Transmembrane protein 209 n=1 Tax=Basidiobolus meristosporus CBS 931.73 TaxID=1314790 RepID=A0A1Y1XB04_9FUNG|nr:hypothetical protein K493DRAFT_320354 [Basidiobolus meristosporus CBS 931.73]|eukprot:ORX82897.1 hypothetical protein K493DRAFT_320354 [Basidiobolus meristosporus CBS 931.73]
MATTTPQQDPHKRIAFFESLNMHSPLASAQRPQRSLPEEKADAPPSTPLSSLSHTLSSTSLRSPASFTPNNLARQRVPATPEGRREEPSAFPSNLDYNREPAKEIPFTPTAQTTGYSQSVSTPRAIQQSPNSPTPPGNWEHPALASLEKARRKKGITSETPARVRNNFFALVWADMVVGLEYLLFLVFLWNFLEALWKYFKPAEAYADLPLTPGQRKLLGLDPKVQSTASEKVIKAVTPPTCKKSPSIAKPNKSGTPGKSYIETYMERRYSGTPTPSRSSLRFGNSVLGSPLSPSRNARAHPSASIMGDQLGASTSVGLEYEAIRSTSEVEQMLELDSDESKNSDFRADTNPVGLSNLFSSTIPLQKYYTAVQDSPSTKETAKIEHMIDGFIYQDPQTVLDDLGIDDKIDAWGENMRRWIATKVLHPLVDGMHQIDRILHENGLEHLDCKSASYLKSSALAVSNAVANSTTAPSSGAPGSMFGSTGNNMSLFGNSSLASSQSQKPQNLFDLSQKFSHIPITQERLKIEKYLTIPGFDAREYIVERIETLARGHAMAAYRWETGATHWGANKTWNTDLPTDAQIVIHLFCAFMDLAMPAETITAFGGSPFTFRHFVPVDGKPDAKDSIVQIKQLTRNPPHFCILVGNKCCDVYPQRSNLFQTLALFVHYIKTESAGYLGVLNINGKALDLESVLEKDYD